MMPAYELLHKAPHPNDAEPHPFADRCDVVVIDRAVYTGLYELLIDHTRSSTTLARNITTMAGGAGGASTYTTVSQDRFHGGWCHPGDGGGSDA